MSPRKVRRGISFQAATHDLLQKASNETGAYVSTIADQAVLQFLSGEGHSESLKGKVTVIKSQQSQSTLGNKLYSFEKEDRQIAKIEKLVKAGRLTKEVGEQHKQQTKADYAKSRAALDKQIAEEHAAELEDPEGKYADLRLRIENTRNRMSQKEHEGLLPGQVDYVQQFAEAHGIPFKESRRKLFVGEHNPGGFHKCPECGTEVSPIYVACWKCGAKV